MSLLARFIFWPKLSAAPPHGETLFMAQGISHFPPTGYTLVYSTRYKLHVFWTFTYYRIFKCKSQGKKLTVKPKYHTYIIGIVDTWDKICKVPDSIYKILEIPVGAVLFDLTSKFVSVLDPFWIFLTIR